MAIRNVAFVVFLLPVVISLMLGTLVMGEILKEPERDLNLWQFNSSPGASLQSDSIKITGLKSQYSTTDSIEIQISVTDFAFDCGDLYITIYDISSSQRNTITQSGYFGQCFERDNLLLPVDDEFSEKIEVPGQYEISVEMNDKHSKKVIITSEKFSVR